MNTPMTPAALATQYSDEELKQILRQDLINELGPWQLDPDKTYINGVNNLDERLVTYSASVLEEAFQRVRENDAPSDPFNPVPQIGLFSVPYSFADEHRINPPDMSKILHVMGTLVRSYA